MTSFLVDILFFTKVIKKTHARRVLYTLCQTYHTVESLTVHRSQTYNIGKKVMPQVYINIQHCTCTNLNCTLYMYLKHKHVSLYVQQLYIYISALCIVTFCTHISNIQHCIYSDCAYISNIQQCMYFNFNCRYQLNCHN